MCTVHCICVRLPKVLYVNIAKGNGCVVYVVPKEHDILCAVPLPLSFWGGGGGRPLKREENNTRVSEQTDFGQRRILIESMDTEKVLFQLKSSLSGRKGDFSDEKVTF